MRLNRVPLSLSRRIVLSVALGLGVTLLLLGLIALWTIHESTEAAYRERVTLARALATRVDDMLRYARTTLEREAADLSIEPGRPLSEQQRRRLADLRFRLGSFVTISVSDAHGRTIFADPSDPAIESGGPLYRPSAVLALSTGQPQIAEYSSAGDRPTTIACLAVPLRDPSGQFAGTLIADFDPGHPALNLVPSGEVGDGIYVQLMNTAGHTLAGTIGFSERLALQHRALLSDLMTSRTAGYRIHDPPPEAGFSSHIVAFAPVPLLPAWGVVLEQRQDLVLETPRRLQWRLAVFGLMAVLLAGVTAWLDARRVTRPLRHLTAVAARFAGGRLDEPVQVDRADEIGTLARTFEAMRRQLHRSRAEIEAHNSELERRVEAATREVEERNRQLASVNAIATTVSSSLMRDEILDRAMERLIEVTGLEHGCFRLLPEGDTGQESTICRLVDSPLVSRICSEACLCGRAARLGVPLVAPDIRAERDAAACHGAGMRSVVAVPLCAQEQVLGVLLLGSSRMRSFEQREVESLVAIGRQIGMALANARLYEEVQSREQARVWLIEQIISAQEGERKRIARDLHDSTGQALTAIIMGLQAMEDVTAADGRLAQRLGRTRDLAEHALADLRELVLDLRPIVLDDLGLVPAIRAYAERHLGEHGVRVSFSAVGLKERLPTRLETSLFRVLQEAITNVAKHAQARVARVQIARVNGSITALIQDDGVGFDPSAADRPLHSGEGLGLLGMRERVELLGGSVQVESSPGAGTSIGIVVPLASLERALP